MRQKESATYLTLSLLTPSEGEVSIGLEELDTGEFLLGVFYLPQGKLIEGYNI